MPQISFDDSNIHIVTEDMARFRCVALCLYPDCGGVVTSLTGLLLVFYQLPQGGLLAAANCTLIGGRTRHLHCTSGTVLFVMEPP